MNLFLRGMVTDILPSSGHTSGFFAREAWKRNIPWPSLLGMLNLENVVLLQDAEVSSYSGGKDGQDLFRGQLMVAK